MSPAKIEIGGLKRVVKDGLVGVGNQVRIDIADSFSMVLCSDPAKIIKVRLNGKKVEQSTYSEGLCASLYGSDCLEIKMRRNGKVQMLKVTNSRKTG